MNSEARLAKGTLIRKSLSQCKLALGSGFYLEAVALSDSLISECLNRIQFFSSEQNFQVKGINQGVRKLSKFGILLLDVELSVDTLDWGKTRNAAIHGFTKLNEYEGMDWDARRGALRTHAHAGYELAQRWLKEAAKHKI